jgi:hypothetical protein
MTAQTKVYYYKQRQQVVLQVSGAVTTGGYQIVYSKELFASKSVDNLIEFVVVNQDQKVVNITDKEITFRLLDHESDTVLLQKQLTPIYPVTGLTSLVIASDELNDITPQQCYYTLEVLDTDSRQYAISVDSAGRSRGVMNITEGTQPAHKPSVPVSVPRRPLVVSTPNVTYYSSTFSSQKKKNVTVQVKYDQFTGSTNLQGSTLPDFSIAYDITAPIAYTDAAGFTGSEVLNVDGFHPYVRLQVVNEGTTVDLNKIGDVTEILCR